MNDDEISPAISADPEQATAHPRASRSGVGWANLSPYDCKKPSPENVELTVFEEGSGGGDVSIGEVLHRYDKHPETDELDAALQAAGWRRTEPWVHPTYFEESERIRKKRPWFPYLETRVTLADD